MNEKDHLDEHTLVLQRVRCGQCHLPLVQVSQGDLLCTLQNGDEENISQPIPASVYRTLTDPTPLLFCPRCHAPLSPAGITVITRETPIAEEKKPTHE